MYRKMPGWDIPRDILMRDFKLVTTLSKEEADVLCGLIREYKPQKIVEVGVDAGGSTSLIMKSLELLGLADTEIYSIDLASKCARKDNVQIETSVGYSFTENIDYYKYKHNHKMLLGKYVFDRLEEVGEGIDFLFIDTVHVLPGEALEFLLLLPHLTSNAIVVLHDTNLHNLVEDYRMATRVLISSITADKFFIPEDAYLNIGAFQITEDTHKYIEDVFSSLLLPWYGEYPNDIIEKYEEEFKKNYSEQCLQIWRCVKKNNNGLTRQLLRVQKRIYVYGCGDLGSRLIRFMQKNRIQIAGIVVSDNIDINALDDFGEKIYHFSEIPSRPEDCVIFLGTTIPEVRELLCNSDYEVRIPDCSHLM